jgi:hypothetical protein
MKPDRKKAQDIGSRLILYKDSIAKHQSEAFDLAHLQVILSDASTDELVAEQELVMALRFYTQEREQKIAWGDFRSCSSEEESLEARRFSLSRTIIFDQSNVKGVEFIKSQILATIQQDAAVDAIKWQAEHARDDETITKLAILWKPNHPPELDTDEDSKKRKKFVEGNLRWCNIKRENRFREASGYRIANTIRAMLEEHRDYWAQHPNESYDDSVLNHIFDFSLYGGNYGLGSLFVAWDMYLESRINKLGIYRREALAASTDAEKALDIEERRKRPIKWPHSHPNAREIIESHIRTIIREDIVADIPKWEQRKKEAEDAKKRAQEYRLLRIQNHRDEFISKVYNLFGQKVLEMISKEDVERYAVGIVERRENKVNLWNSILKSYDFDQNKNSCLYFIRQGEAIKIGITGDLDRRFAQTKTSAAVACKIENVVYTSHGKKLKRKLYKYLSPYNSHLECFVLPPQIEIMLLAAKSGEDIENILRGCPKNPEFPNFDL